MPKPRCGEELAVFLMIFVTAFLRVAQDEESGGELSTQSEVYYAVLAVSLVVLVALPLLFSLAIKFLPGQEY